MPWSLASAAVSAYGVHQQNKNIDKQLAAQARENSLNRKYNLQLAMMQNKWNRQQWQMENAYNSPSAQIQRMRAAGLNPDMMYGGGVSGNLSASSPSMTSGAPSSPMDFTALGSKRTVADIAIQTAQLNQMNAQTEKIKAETEGQGYQNSILASDAAFRDAINQGNLDFQNMQIRGIESDIQMNAVQSLKIRSEIRKLDQETRNLLKQYDLIKSQIANMDAETASRKLHDILDSKESQALIAKMAAETNLSKAECRAIVSRLPYELLGLKNSADLTATENEIAKENKEFVSLQGDVLEWQFNQDKSYDDWKRSIGIAGDAVNVLEGLASIIGTAFGGGKPTRVRGFGK